MAEENNPYWPDWLAWFLIIFILVAFFWGLHFNVGLPLFWVLCVVLPALILYSIGKWLDIV